MMNECGLLIPWSRLKKNVQILDIRIIKENLGGKGAEVSERIRYSIGSILINRHQTTVFKHKFNPYESQGFAQFLGFTSLLQYVILLFYSQEYKMDECKKIFFENNY